MQRISDEPIDNTSHHLRDSSIGTSVNTRSKDGRGQGRLGPVELWKVLKPRVPRPRSLVFISLLSLVTGVCQAGLLIVIGQVAVGVTAEDSDSLGFLEEVDTSVLLIAAFVLAAGMTISATAAIWQASKLAAEALSAIRIRVTDAFMKSSWSIRSRERDGHLQELLTTHAKNASLAVLAVGSSFASILSCVALVIAALVVQPLAAAAVAAAGTALALAFRPLNARLRRASIVVMQRDVGYASSVAEALSLTPDLVVFGAGENYEKRLRRQVERSSQAWTRASFLQRVIPEWFRSGIMALILVGLTVLAARGAAGATALTVVILLLLRAVAYAREITVTYSRLQELVPYIERLDEQVATYRRDSLSEQGATLESVARIQLDSVCYTYPTAETRALRDVSLVIERGETIGIVGPSGSGKSSLMQLLLRLRAPDAGRFLVNGLDASDYSAASYARRVVYVAQDPVVFDGSVADNIRFFRPDITDEAVEQAAISAHLHDEILKMPNGYRTELSGSGGGISGGQRQRLCIARALAGSPDMIVLDEPTSSLDAQSEAAVRATLADLSQLMTLVIISHRMSTLRSCDKVAVLHNGAVSAIGTAEELERTNSFYRDAVSIARGD